MPITADPTNMSTKLPRDFSSIMAGASSDSDCCRIVLGSGWGEGGREGGKRE